MSRRYIVTGGISAFPAEHDKVRVYHPTQSEVPDGKDHNARAVSAS